MGHPPRTARIQAVVFDLFRTLVDPEGVNPEAYRRIDRLASHLGIGVAPLQEWWRSSREQRLRRRAPRLAELLGDFCEKQRAPRSEATIEAALSVADAFHDQALLHPHDHVVRTLKDLRALGVRIGILSNTDEHEIRLWPKSPLASLADAVGLSIDTGHVKPEFEAYRWILDALGGIEPGRAIFIGDGEGHELRGAKQAGFGKVFFLREFVAFTAFQAPETLQEIALEADASLDHLRDILSSLD